VTLVREYFARGVARQRRAWPTQSRQQGKLGILTQLQVERYSNESGLRDIMIVEKGVVLIHLLKLLSDRGRPVVGHSQ
jgi:hypothetical protein